MPAVLSDDTTAAIVMVAAKGSGMIVAGGSDCPRGHCGIRKNKGRKT